MLFCRLSSSLTYREAPPLVQWQEKLILLLLHVASSGIHPFWLHEQEIQPYDHKSSHSHHALDKQIFRKSTVSVKILHGHQTAQSKFSSPQSPVRQPPPGNNGLSVSRAGKSHNQRNCQGKDNATEPVSYQLVEFGSIGESSMIVPLSKGLANGRDAGRSTNEKFKGCLGVQNPRRYRTEIGNHLQDESGAENIMTGRRHSFNNKEGNACVC